MGYVASKEAIKNFNRAKHLRSVEKYNKCPKVCPHCKTLIHYESRKNKFCSRSCSIYHTKRKRGFKKGVEVLCFNCGKKTKKNARKYCSSNCFHEYKWKLKKEQIYLNGRVTEIRQAKKYLKEVRGDSCQMCGNTTWLGKPILLMCDHINGNSQDWRLDNLRMICSNCDATTPFYKNKNKGNGRAYRRQRYKEGKSF